MLERLKRLIGLDPIQDPYEREVLEREHRRASVKIHRLRARLGGVQCSTCPKEDNPRAQRLIDKIRTLEERQEEIEAQLGEMPSPPASARSKRLKSRNPS